LTSENGNPRLRAFASLLAGSKVIAVDFIVSTIIRCRQRFAAVSADLRQSTRGGVAAMTG